MVRHNLSCALNFWGSGSGKSARESLCQFANLGNEESRPVRLLVELEFLDCWAFNVSFRKACIKTRCQGSPEDH